MRGNCRTGASGSDAGERGAGAGASLLRVYSEQSAWLPQQAAAFAEEKNLRTELLASFNLSNYAVDRFGPRHRDFAEGRHWPLSTRMRDERIRESWRSRRRVYRDIAGHEVLTARWRLIRTGNPA